MYQLYPSQSPDLQTSICQTRIPAETHYWHTRVQLLTDAGLISQFAHIQSYFTETKPIAVLTYFESNAGAQGVPGIREDWYLMKDVGIVGIGQARWDVTGQNDPTSRLYFDAQWMKLGTSVYPHLWLTATRAYLGGSLTITPISPSTSWPIRISPSQCYTVKVESILPGGAMPYDGRMERLKETAPQPIALWSRAIGGAPHWAANGYVTECLPSNFPLGENRVKLRPYITPSPSTNEVPYGSGYSEMPWSSNDLWVIVQ